MLCTPAPTFSPEYFQRLFLMTLWVLVVITRKTATLRLSTFLGVKYVVQFSYNFGGMHIFIGLHRLHKRAEYKVRNQSMRRIFCRT